MIIVKAPMRISFVGGGSDLPSFYTQSPGKVISSTINKFVYTIISPAPLLKGITIRYAVTEIVQDINNLKNSRAREALKLFNIKENIEIAIVSDLPVGTGLGGSSSFAVGLVKGLSTYLGKPINKKEAADTACSIEIDLVKDPIGKQDQYASSFGGFNVLEFGRDGSVSVDPVYIDYKIRSDFTNHCMLFFTGLTRDSAPILKEQSNNTIKKIDQIKKMVKLVEPFRKSLLEGNYEKLGEMLHKNWLTKKTLTSKISNKHIDNIYNIARKNGTWGGKLLGAGAGGCMLFVAPPEKHEFITKELTNYATNSKLSEFKKIPFEFTQSGADTILNN